MKAVTPKQMAELDKKTIAAGTPSDELMDRARWAAEQIAAERLRGQRAPQPVARLGRRDASGFAGALEGVAHGRGEDGAVGAGVRRCDQPVDVVRAQVGPRGVVHQQQLAIMDAGR